MDAESIIADFTDALLSVDRVGAYEVLQENYSGPQDFPLMEAVIMDSLLAIGDGWDSGKYALAQVYMSGVICEELLDSFLPESKREREKSPRLGIGVLLDHHSLGKRMVISVIRSAGYEIIDLGQGLSVDSMVDLAVENNIEILLISTLMLPSALKVGQVQAKLDNLGRSIRVIVGGAPFRFDPELWKQVGADAVGGNATDVVDLIERLAGGRI